MSNPLSTVYNTDMGKDVLETEFLYQPKGRKGWCFRMRTPEALIGYTNPKTGRPYGKEIREGQGTAITLPEIGTGTDKNRFMQKVRHFLDSEKDHITLQKIRRDEQLTPQDLDELQRMFIEAGVGAPEEVAQVSGEEGLGVFLRSVLGLDREAAKRALGRFASAENLTADQTEFIDLIVNHLTERGYIDPKFLYESPFTDLDDKGVSGVFEAADVKELVGLLRSVKRRAAA